MSAPAPAGEAPKKATSLADLIGIVVGSQFLTTLIGLAQSLLVVRLVAKAEYGSYAFVMALAGTGRELGLLAIPDSLLYFAPKLGRPQLAGLVRQSMRLLAGLGLLVGGLLASLSLAPDLFLEGRSGLTRLLLLASLTVVVAMPASVYGNAFVATENHRRMAGISMVVTVLGAACTLVPAFFLPHPVEWIVGLQTVTTAVRFALSEWVWRGLQTGPTEPFPGGVRAQLAYVLPLAVTRFAALFNQRLDRFIVGIFFAATEFADFAVGAQELPLVSILPYTVASMMLPKLVELYGAPDRLAGARAAVELWHSGIRKTTLVMVPIAAFFLVAAEPLMHLLYGAKYVGAAVPFRIYSSLLLLRVTGYGIMLMAFGQTALILRVQIAGMVFNVAASLLLLPKVGMIGAPLAAVSTQVFMIVFLLVRIERVAKVGLRGIFPWSHYGRVALATAVAVAPLGAGLVLLGGRLHPGVLLAVGLPVVVAIFLPVATALGTLTPEDRAYVGRWLRLEPLRKKGR